MITSAVCRVAWVTCGVIWMACVAASSGDGDFHDVIFVCFVRGLILPPEVGHGFDSIGL